MCTPLFNYDISYCPIGVYRFHHIVLQLMCVCVLLIVYYRYLCLFQAKKWVKELRKMLGDSCTLCIVGNKMDLEKNRTVTGKEAEE